MLWFIKFLYGKPIYAVKFTGINCNKSVFLDHIHVSTHRYLDLDLIEKYGLSIRAAKCFMEQKWFLTDRGYLVRGEVPKLMSLRASIPIDSNLDFLTSYSLEKIRRGYTGIPVHINGFHKEDSGVYAIGTFRVHFLDH
jgi:hypothetical protein